MTRRVPGHYININLSYSISEENTSFDGVACSKVNKKIVLTDFIQSIKEKGTCIFYLSTVTMYCFYPAIHVCEN